MLVIRLQSSDKEVFEVNRDVISLSSTLDTMLRDLGFDSNDAEDVGDPIPLANVNSEILKKVLEWCVHHKDDPPTESLSDEHSCDDLSAWDFEFFSVDLEKHFKILEAANYLEIRGLMEMGSKVIANMMRGKSPGEIRRRFNITSDFTPEEEEIIRRENEWAEG